MKRLTVTLIAASLALFSCNDSSTKSESTASADSSANETKDTMTASAPVDTAAMNKAWMAYMAPGEEHKMIAKDNGTWTEEVSMWMDPSAPPEKMTGTVKNTMMLGGRYQQSRHTGNYNGQPFEGIGTLAYDNSRKVYVNTWVDNMGTGIMYMEGTWDNAVKTINFKGKATDPVTGKEMNIRQTFKIIDDNTQEVEAFDTRNGKENKTMQIKLTRKK